LSEVLRSFVALPVPAPANQQLFEVGEALVDRLEPKGCKLRLVPRQQLHLTLAFLGQTPRDRLDQIIEQVARVAIEHGEIHSQFDAFLALPHLRRAQVLALGLSDPEGALQRLAEDLAGRLHELGLFAPPRQFLAHVTVARLNKPARLTVADLDQPPPDHVITFDTIRYLESRLEPSGAIHTPLCEDQPLRRGLS